MAWTIADGRDNPRQYDPSQARGNVFSTRGWAWRVKSEDEPGRLETICADVTAEAEGALAKGELLAESEKAISSQGRTAIEPYLGRDQLPARVLITTAGIREP